MLPAAEKNGQSCVADADYFVPGSENKIKYKVSICGGCDNLNHIHLFPPLFLVADYVAVPGENTLNKTGYWEYTAFTYLLEIHKSMAYVPLPFYTDRPVSTLM